MDCKRSAEQLLDYLDGGLDDRIRAEVESHLDGCLACSTELESLRETCARLDRLPAASPGLGSKQRFEEMLRAHEFAREGKPNRGVWRIAAAVLLVGLGVVAGYGIKTTDVQSAFRSDDMTRYLMTVYEVRDETDQIPRERMRATGLRYRSWERELKQQGRLLDVALLRTDGAASIREVEGRTEITALAVPTDREAMTYYWLIQATDYDEALQISRGCPMLSLGARVELREIENWEPPKT